MTKVMYSEPEDYIPKEIRKKFKIGEFHEIPYEKAMQIGLEAKPNADTVTEYDNAYVFSAKEDSNYIGGWGHTSIVVMKYDGEVLHMPEFVANGAGKEIKSFRIEKNDKEGVQ